MSAFDDLDLAGLAEHTLGRMKDSVKDDLAALDPASRQLVERVLTRSAAIGALAFTGGKVDPEDVADVQAQVANLNSASATITGRALNAGLVEVGTTVMKIGASLVLGLV